MQDGEIFIHSPNSSLEPVRYWRGSQVGRFEEQPTHILKNRLVAGEITAIYGEPKKGKTFIAVNCAVAAALDLKFWGEYFNLGGATVVYFAAERVYQVRQRLKAACLALGLSEVPENIIVVDGRSRLGLSSEERQRQLEELVRQKSPALVIFDTYARMIDNNEDKAGDATMNILALERIINSSTRACAGLLVHHTGKETSKGMRGSNALLASVTTEWKVTEEKSHIRLDMTNANSFENCEPAFFKIETFVINGALSNGDALPVGVAISIPTPLESKYSAHTQTLFEIWGQDQGTWFDKEEIRDKFRILAKPISYATVDRTLKNAMSNGLIDMRKQGKRYVYRISELGLLEACCQHDIIPHETENPHRFEFFSIR